MPDNQIDQLKEEFYSQLSQKSRALCLAERERYTNSMESFDALCSRKEQEALNFGKELLEGESLAVRLIVNRFNAVQDQEAIEGLRQGAERLASAALIQKNHLNESTLVNDIAGYSPTLMEKIFQVGVHYLNEGQYENAAKVFGFIILLDPGYSACWLSLGLSLKLVKNWEESLEALEIAHKMDSHNPFSYFHEAACYKELGRKKEAQEALKIASQEALKNPKYAALLKAINKEESDLN